MSDGLEGCCAVIRRNCGRRGGPVLARAAQAHHETLCRSFSLSLIPTMTPPTPPLRSHPPRTTLQRNRLRQWTRPTARGARLKAGERPHLCGGGALRQEHRPPGAGAAPGGRGEGADYARVRLKGSHGHQPGASRNEPGSYWPCLCLARDVSLGADSDKRPVRVALDDLPVSQRLQVWLHR